MGLLTTYGSDNRVIINDKVVTYSKNRIYGEWTYASASVVYSYNCCWEYHRYCTKQYMYVGMDRTTAQSCAQAMITKYTRTFNISEWVGPEFSDVSGGSICMADVVIQKRAGHMYDVVVSVREDDSRNRRASVSPSTLFSSENRRDYDEGD